MKSLFRRSALITLPFLRKHTPKYASYKDIIKEKAPHLTPQKEIPPARNPLENPNLTYKPLSLPADMLSKPAEYFQPLETSTKPPFSITRTASNRLPVYRGFLYQKSKIVTTVRRIEGDRQVFIQEIRKLLDNPKIYKRAGSIEIVGDHVQPLTAWMSSLGF
eukprot:TRINITY_DN5459_c0_g1_i1.p1 TRINITY_DN5459_c0_g1~~TRINITY_DN5459_c0_g1_i1.p1  ORF type:complete len:162 (+),score=34.59 TRINITY_DN5459_c0_g1_i1:247-732(+)